MWKTECLETVFKASRPHGDTQLPPPYTTQQMRSRYGSKETASLESIKFQYVCQILKQGQTVPKISHFHEDPHTHVSHERNREKKSIGEESLIMWLKRFNFPSLFSKHHLPLLLFHHPSIVLSTWQLVMLLFPRIENRRFTFFRALSMCNFLKIKARICVCNTSSSADKREHHVLMLASVNLIWNVGTGKPSHT